MSSSSPRSNFLRLWTLIPSLCSAVAATLIIEARSQKFLDLGIAVLVYWIVLGFLQWRLLKTQVSWAYQWGLVTLVGGIASQWLSALLMVFLSTIEDKMQQVQLLKEFLAQPGLTLLKVCSNSSFMFSSGGFAFLIFPFIACLIGGVFLGWVQWFVLRVRVQSASYSLLVISGVAWLLGPVLLVMSLILASFVNTSVGRSWTRFPIFLMVSVLLSLNGMMGSFLKGRVLVKLLKRHNVLTHHEN